MKRNFLVILMIILFVILCGTLGILIDRTGNLKIFSQSMLSAEEEIDYSDRLSEETGDLPSAPTLFVLDIEQNNNDEAVASPDESENSIYDYNAFLLQYGDQVDSANDTESLNSCKGIDISSHQGSIGWSVVSSQLDFVFIRCGYRSYDSSGALHEDEKFDENITDAKDSGLDIGVYFFSQAVSVNEAIEEAEFVLTLLDGLPLELPVVIDFEYVENSQGRLEQAGLSRDAATNICLAFCRTIEHNGYTAMIYTNTGLLESALDEERLCEYPIWISHWTSDADHSKTNDYWQYSCTGAIAGVEGNVDLDLRSHIIPDQVSGLTAEPAASGHVLLSWDRIPGVWGYRIQRFKAGGWTTCGMVCGASSVSWTDESCEFDTEYTYRVNAVNIYSGELINGPSSQVASTVCGDRHCVAFAAISEQGRIRLTSKDSEYVLSFYVPEIEKNASILVDETSASGETVIHHTGKFKRNDRASFTLSKNISSVTITILSREGSVLADCTIPIDADD